MKVQLKVNRGNGKKLLFVTHNKYKFQEISQVIPSIYKLISLKDIGYFEDIEETEESLEGNAVLKARVIFEKTDCDCFADDTGLEVEALDGKPGVYSARYAGKARDYEANNKLLLKELFNHKNRNAQFRTVIALILGEKEYLFEGITKGVILKEERGKKGFGYDPIFLPEGYDKSFAEMSLGEKNLISHRARAIRKMVRFLDAGCQILDSVHLP